MDNIIELTDDNFQQEIEKSDTPVLVDFWADWCAPCKMLSPIIDQISEEYKDQVKICKANIDMVADNISRYKVQSVPTILIFKDGKEKERHVGVVGKDIILDSIT